MQEVFEIPVDKYTNQKQQKLGIILFSLLDIVLVLFAIAIRNKPENIFRIKA